MQTGECILLVSNSVPQSHYICSMSTNRRSLLSGSCKHLLAPYRLPISWCACMSKGLCSQLHRNSKHNPSCFCKLLAPRSYIYPHGLCLRSWLEYVCMLQELCSVLLWSWGHILNYIHIWQPITSYKAPLSPCHPRTIYDACKHLVRH